jgi:methyltransferase (TIGR00027 family)
MRVTRAQANVARTAHLTAWVRALGRLTSGGDAANADDLAERFLLPFQRRLTRVPNVALWLIERTLPGAFGYFNARTQYFDGVLRQEARAGLEQLVILGAGFDSRPLRFAAELRGVRVFAVDMAQVLAIRAERLAGVSPPATPTIAVPVDFERDDLGDALSARGYASDARTLFLWEGVAYYLPIAAVHAILAIVAARSAPGSSILFDYVTQAFFEGDHSGYGAKRLADSWRRLGDVNRSGVGDVAALVRPHGLQLRSDIDADELGRRHLASLPGPALRAWGPMRIAHAARLSSAPGEQARAQGERP